MTPGSPLSSLRLFVAVIVLLAIIHPIVDGFTRPLRGEKIASSSSSTTALHGKKKKKRARMEREFEEMMDNDWRVFRAKLVAQERAERAANGGQWSKPPSYFGNSGGEQQARPPPGWPQSIPPTPGWSQSPPPTGWSDEHPITPPPQPLRPPTPGGRVPLMADELPMASRVPLPADEGLAKQSQLSDLFAGPISSVFRNSASSNQGPGSMSGSMQQQQGEPKKKMTIFEGNNVGGMPLEVLLDSNEDPFITEAELPLLLPKPTSIDKHRWAHPLPHVETGCVLLANERLGGDFHQSVVLVVQHCEKNGSIGIVINRPMRGDLETIGSQTDSKLDASLKKTFPSSTVTYGGPVLSDEFSVLHGYGLVEGSNKLCGGVYVGGSTEELVDAVDAGDFDPESALFCKGHASWVGGQLDREIANGVWYPAAVSADFVLRHANADASSYDNGNSLWYDILTCIGGQFGDIARFHGGRGGPLMP